MPLRPLVISGAMLTSVVLLPLVLACALAGHMDVARGLLLGFLVGLLNSFLLARKLDRVRTGRDPLHALKGMLRRNMLVRFTLIFAIGAAASLVPGIHLLGMAGGIAAYLIISLAYFSWVVVRYCRKEGGSPVYG